MKARKRQERPLGVVSLPVEWLVVGVGDELVEGLVGLLTHGTLVLHPDGLDRVAHLGAQHTTRSREIGTGERG